MIAKWIARAMLKGEDHLLLNLDELAKWQANGCRLSLGAPYGLHGSYIVRQLWHWRESLQKMLRETSPDIWPVGSLTFPDSGNRCTVIFPRHGYQQTATGIWRVPLIPSDPEHCLDSWASDIFLEPLELAALKPIAKQLVERCLVRCEVQSLTCDAEGQVLWNEGRQSLVRLAEIEQSRVLAWFGLQGRARNVPILVSQVNTTTCVEDCKALTRANRNEKYLREKFSSRRLISKDEKHAHELQIRGSGLACNFFTVKVFSSLLSSWPDCEGLMKLELKLSRYELVALKSMIEDSLGLPPISMPDGADIAVEFQKHHDRMNTRNIL